MQRLEGDGHVSEADIQEGICALAAIEGLDCDERFLEEDDRLCKEFDAFCSLTSGCLGVGRGDEGTPAAVGSVYVLATSCSHIVTKSVGLDTQANLDEVAVLFHSCALSGRMMLPFKHLNYKWKDDQLTDTQ